MLSSLHMKSVALTLICLSASLTSVQAKELTLQEQRICPNLNVCLDIIRRHDATEFDYTELEREFRRFSSSGRKALFDLLDTPAGNAEIAEIISGLGPLNMSERAQLDRNWSLERASNYLPLLMDGHPLSRDMLLLSLGSEQASVREKARIALARLPKAAARHAMSEKMTLSLLSALSRDPIAEAAPYLSQLNAEGHEDAFGRLLLSADVNIVSSAYEALYRNRPSHAFNLLLTTMGRAESAEQVRALGTMLASRHTKRSDGFYLKFASDISGDQTRPVSARAVGLHAVFVADESGMPDFTPARAEALTFLVSGQSLTTQDQYLPVLKRAKAERAMSHLWTIAKQETWVNRDRISTFFTGEKIENRVIFDLLSADDLRTFQSGLTQAKPIHEAAVRAAIHHPIQAISELSGKKLGLSNQKRANSNCTISRFDTRDGLTQMPFFDSAWVKTKNQARVTLDRKYLTAAHAVKTGWIAGYDVKASGLKSIHSGGALVSFDNKTGAFAKVGNFNGPVAILPDRPLKLGITTERFWVIDQQGELGDLTSAYRLDLSGPKPVIKHMGALPDTAHLFSVAPTGDLLMQFKDKNQAPIRLSPRGVMSLACGTPRSISGAPAPN